MYYLHTVYIPLAGLALLLIGTSLCSTRVFLTDEIEPAQIPHSSPYSYLVISRLACILHRVERYCLKSAAPQYHTRGKAIFGGYFCVSDIPLRQKCDISF